MNKGVELLLKRMDSHPEEFAENHDYYHEREHGKWDAILNELYHRAEIIDKDNGVDLSEGYIRPIRRSKPLSYLSDEEVLTLLAKLEETRAKLFEQRVMGALLNDPKPNYGAALTATSVGGYVNVNHTTSV